MLAILCISLGCAKKKRNYLNPEYKFSDIEERIQVGTPSETVILHFGEPLFIYPKEGTVRWSYYIDDKLLTKDADFVGFIVDIFNGKVNELKPVYMDKFISAEYTFEYIERMIPNGTPIETVVSHFGRPYAEDINKDGVEMWIYLPEPSNRPKSRKFKGFFFTLSDGKVSELSPIIFKHRQ